ncbi:AAA domain-containing protein [Hydrogenophaga sp. BPS33]|uniref:AAA domain-containing protein n=1 Tax=Hydrogenophaga sp. BPS33 TaxID=2651974 RepID=UPI00131FDE10|nr:AAA domain-containing protein [Hydrogenophaga sp. BPS33]QHE87218.1 DUF4011 domain-containing protein [Hydrogenophaga sp. BPS33]
MTELVRVCPSCTTERPLFEMTCEGQAGDSNCNWDLSGIPISPSGWRPAPVIAAVSIAPTEPGASEGAVCTNGHPVADGDLLCLECGADVAAPGDAPEVEQPASETVIGGWHVLQQISSTTGRRDRYLVEEDGAGRRGVLTLYHHGWEPDPLVYETLERVSNEHVPRTFAFGRWEERAFEVAEELTAGTLADLGTVVVDSTGIRRIAYELGKALDALAEVGLRHRDIRPGTLLVRNRDPLDLVVSGFGSARLSEYDLDIVAPLEITRYTAPEAVAGGVAAASDWWSLGIVLLEQITGGKCFEGIEPQAFLIHVLTNGVPVPKDIPSDVALLLRGLLTRDRQRRWKWTQVQEWLDGKAPEVFDGLGEGTSQPSGPSVSLGGQRFFTLSSYALAAASQSGWEEGRDQLARGVVTAWAQTLNVPPQQLADLRRVVRDESLSNDSRLLLGLKVLNPDMPPVMRGVIVSPRWLLESPVEGYELVTGTVPDLLQDLGQDSWLSRLKSRAQAVRERAANLNVELDEATLRLYLLSASRARLSAEWDTRRRVFPDSEHMGLLSLIERRSLSEEDLIVVLSAAPTLFRSCDAIVEEARQLAEANNVATFEDEVARDQVTWPRSEQFQAVAERIEGFARCGHVVVNGWADEFRLERRLPLAQALVLLAVPQQQWQEPHKQQYVSQILTFFEKKVVTTVLRGPLVRMTIGKSTPRVDLQELHAPRLDAAGLLDHLLQRNSNPIVLDPTPLLAEGTTAHRLHSLERHSQLYKRDTGIDGLYLGFPFLLTKDAKATTAVRIAPVLLWPVRVHHEVGARTNVQVSFDSEREEIRLNPALETLVGQETYKKWVRATEELLGRSSLRAVDVIDAFGSLAVPRNRSLVVLPGPKVDVPVRSLQLECAAVLFHMTFMGQAIGEEIRQLQTQSPIGTGLETALRLRQNEPMLAETARPKEVDRFFTVFSDPSQEKAVLQARTAPGLLVEGPPGTGKSQTIVNMVGDAIGQGRSVLIICQKHAALEVVYKRLVAEDLGDRVVLVNDVNKDRQPIIKAVREQLEALTRRPTGIVDQIQRKREMKAARIEAHEATLDNHHAALHRIDGAVGLSYRALIGELIELETPDTPLEVPALRPMLQRLNIAELATLEEELAPVVRYWLPARYEGSALASTEAFSADLATLNDFREAFNAFTSAEDVRHQVLTTKPTSFEVDDPAPHATWLSSYGNEFLQMPEEQRKPLAKWLKLFREASPGGDMVGMAYLDGLRRTRDALSGCRSQDCDPKLSPLLCRINPGKLAELRKLTAETVEVSGFWSSLNLFKWSRKRRVLKFLQSVGDTPSHPRLEALLRAADLELAWRPLRKELSELHGHLGLPALEESSGPTLLATANTVFSMLQTVARHAAHLQASPWFAKLDNVAQQGSRDAFIHLFTEFDAAFARHQVRTDSCTSLGRLKSWMTALWVQECETAIGSNLGNGARIAPLERALPTLAAYQLFRGRAKQLSQLAISLLGILRIKEDQLDAITPSELEKAARRILNREARLAWKGALEQSCPDLMLERPELESKVASLEQFDQEMRQLNREFLKVHFDSSSIRPIRDWEDITRLTGQRARRLREFVELGAGLGLMKLRPVWLMNPDVASRLLPLKPGLFDTVIYDEASQMPVEYALPTLFRGKVTVVSGDEKQMPPTAFFASKVESDEAAEFDGEMLEEGASEEERDVFEETWNRREIKDCPDLLLLARANLPSERLQIHYRSAYRELIGYSNAAFYGNDLSVPVTVPDETVKRVRPIEMIRVDGVYREQTNQAEAERVVDVLQEIWRAPYVDRPSVGVVTFNRKQADLIQEVIESRAEADPVFREAYGQECERSEQGEDMGVFVKNVENVQGDERDVIVFSSTFGRNEQGTFRRAFGVLGQKGGERRLNVAVTRSRRKVYMVTSMPIAEISDLLSTRRPPATPRDFLQGYMEYARLVSSGELLTSRSLLSRLTVRREAARSVHGERSHDAFHQAVGEFLRSLGHLVKSSADSDAFGLDYAIEHPDTGLFAIGIECDAPRHPLLEHARAREVWRPQVLQRSLRVLHRVSCHGWYHDGERERQNLVGAVRVALTIQEGV